MKLSDFDFDLPNSLIAQYPREKRTDSRLLVLQDDFIDATFSQLGEFLKPKDLLILNDTKVIPARLFGHKVSGGKVEIRKGLKPGQAVLIQGFGRELLKP